MDSKKVIILTANLGNFDTPVDPVKQNIPVDFYRFTDDNFPPITGLTPRFQYRIPKLFGWQMKPGFDYYIWLDGSMSFTRPDSAKWFLDQLGDKDMAVFKHPWRNTIKEEVEHIEAKIDGKYLSTRYKNGLHKKQYDLIKSTNYIDDKLFTSTAFIYRNTPRVNGALQLWWLYQSRYWTCDQVSQPYALKDLDLKIINENQYKIPYLTQVSKHG